MADVDPSDPGETTRAVVDPLQGRILNGRFSILEPIGAGGMGRVYKAIQSPLERVVAVKALHPHFAVKDPGFVRRFILEASLTSKLRHPNTVTVIDYGQTEDGIFYIAMEYLEGRTLADIISREGALPWARCLHIAQQICRSLREAHRLGIVHRDLKPANVMLLDEADHDVVKVLDFGLVKSFLPDDAGLESSKITQAGMLLGSPQYMAPEQARNQLDLRSDIYSLGILLYEMLVGRPPFLGRDYLEVIAKHIRELPPRFQAMRPDLSIPDDVEALVFKCLQKEMQHRFQTMDAVLDALRAAGASAGLVASGMIDPRASNVIASQTPPPAAPTLPIPIPTAEPASGASVSSAVSEPRRRRRTWLALGLAGVLVIGAFSAFLLMRRPEARSHGEGATVSEAPVSPPPAAIEPAAPKTMVRFRVNSDPPGARVFEGARDRGVTPLVFEMPPGEDGTATAELVLILDGYHPLAVMAGGSGDVVLFQRLQRNGTPPPPTRPVRHSSTKPVPVSDSTASYEKIDAPRTLGELAPASGVVASAGPASPAGTSSGPQGGTIKAVEGPEVLPFGEGMTRPVQLEGGKPIRYTREAIQAKVEGLMIVKCVINTTGRLEKCTFLKGLPYMEQVVLDSLYSRVYKPVTYQGKPVSVSYIFDVHLLMPRH